MNNLETTERYNCVIGVGWLGRLRWRLILLLVGRASVVMNVELRTGAELLKLPVLGELVAMNVTSTGVMIVEKR